MIRFVGLFSHIEYLATLAGRPHLLPLRGSSTYSKRGAFDISTITLQLLSIRYMPKALSPLLDSKTLSSLRVEQWKTWQSGIRLLRHNTRFVPRNDILDFDIWNLVLVWDLSFDACDLKFEIYHLVLGAYLLYVIWCLDVSGIRYGPTAVRTSWVHIAPVPKSFPIWWARPRM